MINTADNHPNHEITTDEEETLYQATRRITLWIDKLEHCPALADDFVEDLNGFMRAVPDVWWLRFDQDEAAEREASCASAT